MNVILWVDLDQFRRTVINFVGDNLYERFSLLLSEVVVVMAWWESGCLLRGPGSNP